MSTDKLKIVTWNANGILAKLSTFELLLSSLDIDICLLTETHLTNKNNLSLKNYKVYSAFCPGNTAIRGSSLIIKNTIDHFEISKVESKDIQMFIVQVISLKQNINIGVIYCSPSCSIKKDTFKSLLIELGDRFILGGDFNAKHLDWGSRVTQTRGKELRQAIRELECNFHSTGNPTHWPTDRNKIPDLLDFFISRKVSSNFISIEDSHDFNSDHSAVILNLSEKIAMKPTKPVLTNNSTDWLSFKLELDSKIDLSFPMNSIEELENASETFTKLIQSTAWANTKISKSKKTSDSYPEYIMNKVKEKRKARKRWQQSRDPADKNILNNITQQLRREIKWFKENSLKNFLSNLTAGKDSNYSLWKATKKFKNTVTHRPPIMKPDGNWAKNNKEKAELFSEHLAGIFQPNIGVSDIDVENVTNNYENSIPLVRRKELLKEIKRLKLKKAPGFDLITAQVLKNLPKKAIKFLQLLMNASIKLKYIPSTWKVAEIIMIPKPGKPPIDVKSYRPISLLPIISKLFESIIQKRIQVYIDRFKVIPNHQFGFRKSHATIDQIHRITDFIEKAFERKEICSSVFLDVAQAFDKVWHKGLIYKLNRFLPSSYVKLLSSYLSDRTFRVREENEYSSLKDINAGVPQGSILGPILYLIYTSDLPELENIKVATFADDTSLMATGRDILESTSKLQEANDSISNWCKTWRIKLNETKSVHVNFTLKKIENPPNVTLNNITVPLENKAKYLGMTLDTKLRWEEHVKIKRKELDLKYRDLYWLIGRSSILSNYNKTLIYNQVLKPVWVYGIQISGCAKQVHLNTLQTFQNKVLRNIVNAPWYIRNSDLHRDLNIPLVKDVIRKYAQKHRERLSQHVNAEASQLIRNQPTTRRLRRVIPTDLS